MCIRDSYSKKADRTRCRLEGLQWVCEQRSRVMERDRVTKQKEWEEREEEKPKKKNKGQSRRNKR
eukprot:6098919-Alexandrium_andersonii.AAC.1